MISSAARALRKRAHGLARVLVGLGRRVGEVVQAAMHVGVVVPHSAQSIASITALRLLRRGAVVEIDQRLAVDLRDRIGKSRADRLDVVGVEGRVAFIGHAAASQSSTTPFERLAQSPRPRSSSTSSRKPRPACARPRLRDAARHQVEQMVVVERRRRSRRGRRHVVGKDLEFGLGGELAPRPTAAAPCIISLASVFCASGATMILPWNTPRAAPSSDACEQLAARAVAALRGRAPS